jgi:ATP-dependent Lon protease
MSNKKISPPKTTKSKKSNKIDPYKFSQTKIDNYIRMIQRTILSVQKYKLLDVITAGEMSLCIKSLEILYADINKLKYTISSKKDINYDEVITKLQKVNNELSSIFRTYGTGHLEDLVTVCFGENYISKLVTDENKDIYNVLKKYVHPISYKVMAWNKDTSKNKKKKGSKLKKNRIVEDFMIVEGSKTFDCFDMARTSQQFQTMVYGIKISIQNPDKEKTLIICGIIDDIILPCFDHAFITNKIDVILKNKPDDPIFQTEDYTRFINSRTLKELLVYNNEELKQRYIGYINQTKLMKQKTISQLVKEFLSNTLYGQRTTLIQLLIKYSDPEFQYLAYLLYDLLSNENSGSVDTFEQTLLFDSLPWTTKKYFQDAMKSTIKYTKNLSNFDNNNIPIEQQICLMKADDTVKEKAMTKLKEVKAKSEDSGSKARQYLDGLLKIPFGIYREEEILTLLKASSISFENIVSMHGMDTHKLIPIKKKYTAVELYKYINILRQTIIPNMHSSYYKSIVDQYVSGKRENLIANICYINGLIKKYNLTCVKLRHSGKRTSFMKEHINNFMLENKDNTVVLSELSKRVNTPNNIPNVENIEIEMDEISTNINNITEYMAGVNTVLNDAVHGHALAKRQIERIVGQWINGEQSGYCFGFEGPPGVGKTSLARKGIGNCLKANDNSCRPFSFIALGGSSNGSTLSGHNYTYVGSTWGRIVDIIIENKCMNPIIFIDELDKISKTENGKEIIGILTHLVDPTQNESFQDKYFSGIDLDLSKALFIFSYNDVEQIDKVLLDRIHRIKFNHLTLEDKQIITKEYILPELFKKVGIEDMIHIDDSIITFIIETYTNEAGVRKLKEILFEIISEVNLEFLNYNSDIEIPVVITEETIRSKYLKDRQPMLYKDVHTEPKIGIINGLWANAAGSGGVIPIEVQLILSNTLFDLKLTGMQGDVMKESMAIAKTMAWSLTPESVQKKLVKKFENTKVQGIHVHCPEGAVPKDGPSAGTAITIAIFSILNNKKINNEIAITGEINLQGNVTAIGGLDLKILGGIKAKVKTFIYPIDNKNDFKKFKEKYDKNNFLDGINFVEVSHISEVLKLVFV